MIKKRPNIVGIAGEYFVAAELSQRGLIATITLKNTPKVDLLATNPDNGKSITVQTKTMSVGNNQGWNLAKSTEEDAKLINHYIVLVDLSGPNKLPEYYIFPQKTFCKYLYQKHRKWLKTPGRGGRPHKDNSVRCFDPQSNNKDDLEFGKPYKNNWKILNIW